jgi:hypothetical protein
VVCGLNYSYHELSLKKYKLALFVLKTNSGKIKNKKCLNILEQCP